MKIAIAILLCCAVAMAQDNYDWGRPCDWNHGDGRPACNAAEVAQGNWRNNWDPTAYWVCSTVGVAATAARCPVEGMFDTNSGTCINWANWVWSFECNPPSVA